MVSQMTPVASRESGGDVKELNEAAGKFHLCLLPKSCVIPATFQREMCIALPLLHRGCARARYHSALTPHVTFSSPSVTSPESRHNLKRTIHFNDLKGHKGRCETNYTL